MLTNVFSLFVATSLSVNGHYQIDGCPSSYYPGSGCPDPAKYATCCIALYHEGCDEKCHREICEAGGGWWIPFDNYNYHPYTCEMKFNLGLGASPDHGESLGHSRNSECTNPLLPCQFVEYNQQYNKDCPSTKPENHSLCGGRSITCDYENESIRFQCSNGKWRVLYTRSCELNGERVANGYLRLNEDGCVAAACEAGRVEFHDCSKGCEYWGRYLTPGYTAIDKNFQNKNDENNPRKYVSYRCDYTNTFHTDSGVGCRKGGVNYLDGFIMADRTDSGIKLLWTCRDGHIHTLGGPGALKYPAGAAKIDYIEKSAAPAPAHTGQLNAPGMN